jgi:hypothetical protein
MSKKINKKGYVTISIVLILLVVTIGMSVAVSFLSAGSVLTSQSWQKGETAFFQADSCMEEGLLRLKKDPFYASGDVSFPNGTCHINIDNQSGVYTLKVYFSGADKYWRSIEAEATLVDGVFVVSNWKEKPLVVN